MAGQARVGADQDELADMFSQARPRLVRVAYAILGSHSEAEDVVADCWLRLVAADRAASVRDVEAWAIMTVPRMALDVLRSARVRREQYVGPWLPEPLVGTVYAEPAAGSWAGLGASARMAADPADKVTLDDQVSYALLVVLETLTPAERTAFVLHDLFGLQFDEVAAVVGRSPGAARQLASRARRHVRTRGTPPPVDAAEHRKVVSAFAVAVTSGDLTALIQLLDPEVVLISDGGGMVSSARRPVTGADRVARFLLGIVAKAGPRDYLQPVAVNGSPGFAVYQAGRLVTVVSLTLAGERVARVDMVRAPGKLPKATCSHAPLPRATLVPHARVIDDGSR